jgi:hypothetical protein
MFCMEILKGNWCAIADRGMEAFPVAIVLYPYPEIVWQLF